MKASEIIEKIKAGAKMVVPSYTRWIVVDAKTVSKFERAGQWLLKDDGRGYRLRLGKSSVYLFPEQVRII